MMSQSWIMMYAAGGAWQYGKRRISAMSNEEFNKLTPINLLEEHTAMLREAIPSIQKSLNDMTPLIKTLMEQFGDFVNEAIKAIPQTVSNILGTPGGEFSNIPTTESISGTSTGLPPPGTAAFLHYFKSLSDATKLDVPEETFDTLSKIPEVRAKQLQAIQKQKDYLAQQKKDSIAAQNLKFTQQQMRKGIDTIPTPVPQISQVGGTGSFVKKKAGQSQIMARKEFISKIANSALNLRNATNPDNYKRHQEIMAMWQQKLVNLLARYRF